MDRRRDFRHALRYCLSLTPAGKNQVHRGWTENVSASGLFCRSVSVSLRQGDEVDVQLTVRPTEPDHSELLQLSARGAVTRAKGTGIAVHFEHPLEF
ncbi:MAG: PilZ domain-containing protein [Planctomycetota bacterium]